MPAKNSAYWTRRAAIVGGTWYLEERLDRWTAWLWKQAVRQLRPPGHRGYAYAIVAVDVGCGDGQFAYWCSETFGWSVRACDLFRHAPADWGGRVSFLWGVDAETIGQEGSTKGWIVDVSLVSGVLECVSDWRKALHAVCTMTREAIVVVEDLRERPASYQVGLAHKTAITWQAFRHAVDQEGWHVVRWVPMTTIDRALLVWSPSWLWPIAVPVSAILDAGLMRLGWFRKWARFRACLLSRVHVN